MLFLQRRFEKMNSISIFGPVTPPPIKCFLNEMFWAIHEAVFVLTAWPKDGLYLTSIIYSPGNNRQNLEKDRSFIYLPEDSRIDPKLYGREFEQVYNDLKSAVENGALESKTHRLCGVLHFVTPCEVITWALLKGYILPKDLQEAIDIRQDEESLKLPGKTRNILPIKVKEKIVAQFFLAKDPKQSRIQLYNAVRDYIDGRNQTLDYMDGKEQINTLKYNRGQDLTATRKNLNELYESPGRKGRRKEIKKTANSYIPKAINEVIRKDAKGNVHYNFLLFKEAMLQAAYFKSETMKLKRIAEITKRDFFAEFLDDDVIRLYLQENEYIFQIIIKCIEWAWSDLSLFKELLEIEKISVNRMIQMKDGKFVKPTDM